MGTVSFYTTGKEMNGTIKDIFNEGNYHSALEVLREGGFNIHQCRAFFMNAIQIEGDTRKDGIFGVEAKAYSKKKFAKILEASIHLFTRQKMSFSVEDLLSNQRKSYAYRDSNFQKNVDALFELFPIEVIKATIFERRLRRKGYRIVKKIEGWNFDGVILKDGTIVKCGHQMHNQLYPLLYDYNKVDYPDWTEDNESVHISSSQMSGTLAYQLENYHDWGDDRNKNLTPEILKVIRDNHNELSFYGMGGSVMGKLMEFYEAEAEHGGKFGKLTFLKNCYPNIKLPKFSKEEIKGVKNCIRTSPRLSMAGLLTSKFDIDENSIKEIEADWEKYKHVVGKVKYIGGEEGYTNKLHYFYQEYLEGVNGVAHFRGRDEEAEFTYDCSENRGDIVDGKKGEITLHISKEVELKEIAQQLHKDIGRDIQLEFVIHNDEVYIVQMRTLEKSNEYRSYPIDEDRVIAKGKSFSMKSESKLTVDDVLIIDEDCESELVIGKKAVIVRNDVEFSHALALSFSLKIPSIYGVGKDFELPEVFNIDANGRDGYILKPYK